MLNTDENARDLRELLKVKSLKSLRKIKTRQEVSDIIIDHLRVEGSYYLNSLTLVNLFTYKVDIEGIEGHFMLYSSTFKIHYPKSRTEKAINFSSLAELNEFIHKLLKENSNRYKCS